jgi:hypothetical protein
MAGPPVSTFGGGQPFTALTDLPAPVVAGLEQNRSENRFDR